MVVGIGDIEDAASEGDALGVLELALAADAVAVAVPTRSRVSTAALVPAPASGSGPPIWASNGSAARS
ncbi:MAG: hypothetical protein K6U88_08340 [Dehalococcoidia bacterium]|nr:hypothetical protein [Dehalococcoidia bacterium]